MRGCKMKGWKFLMKKEGCEQRGVQLAALLLGGLMLSTAGAVSLDDCVEAALQQNPGLQGTVHRIAAARAAADQARSAYYPVLSLSGNYSRTDNPSQAFMMALNQRGLDMTDPALNVSDPADTDNLRLSSSARYRLYDGGQRRAAHRMTQLSVDAEQRAADVFRNQLIYQVMDGYYRALQARDVVLVRRETLESMQENLRVAQERFDAGSALITDVLNLDVQVEQAREEWIRAKHGLELAVHALNTAIGTEMATAANLAAPEESEVGGRKSEVGEARLSAEHPELMAARAMLDIREQGVRKSRRAYAPTLNAYGSVDWDSDVSSDLEQSYLVGVVAEWDLFDGFRRRNELGAARAQRAEARADYQQIRNELQLGLRQALIRKQEAQERIAVTEAGKTSATRALEITRDRYQQGAATLSDLLTAQTGLTAMQTRNRAAFYDYLTALANVKRAQGQLIHVEGSCKTPRRRGAPPSRTSHLSPHPPGRAELRETEANPTPPSWPFQGRFCKSLID